MEETPWLKTLGEEDKTQKTPHPDGGGVKDLTI
jgi:hypothetical protein